MALPCGSTILWSINPPFDGLSPCKGQVAYALLTRAPVSGIATIPLDLHVLSLPLAFILSQDQTLRCIENFKCFSVTSRCARIFRSFYLIPTIVVRLLSFSISSMNYSAQSFYFFLFNPLFSGESSAKVILF